MESSKTIQTKLSNSKVVVTGGTGFIGSHLVERLVSIGAKVRVLSRTGNPEYLQEVISRIELRKCDLTNRAEVERALKETEYIFHLVAAIPKRGIQYGDPTDTIKTNIFGTINICNAILHNSNFKKLIVASTAEVYGIPRSTSVTEEHPTNPLSFYGASKLAAEKLVQIYSEKYKLDIAILRYSTVFGSREGAYRRAIPNFIKNLLNKEAPQIYGTGDQIRNYIYVGDAVEYTLRAISETPSITYNVGGVNTSIKQLAKTIATLTKCKVKPAYITAEANQYDFILDSSRIERELGYYPRTPLEVGLSEEIQWYLNTKK